MAAWGCCSTDTQGALTSLCLAPQVEQVLRPSVFARPQALLSVQVMDRAGGACAKHFAAGEGAHAATLQQGRSSGAQQVLQALSALAAHGQLQQKALGAIPGCSDICMEELLMVRRDPARPTFRNVSIQTRCDNEKQHAEDGVDVPTAALATAIPLPHAGSPGGPGGQPHEERRPAEGRSLAAHQERSSQLQPAGHGRPAVGPGGGHAALRLR